MLKLKVELAESHAVYGKKCKLVVLRLELTLFDTDLTAFAV